MIRGARTSSPTCRNCLKRNELAAPRDALTLKSLEAPDLQQNGRMSVAQEKGGSASRDRNFGSSFSRSKSKDGRSFGQIPAVPKLLLPLTMPLPSHGHAKTLSGNIIGTRD